MSPIVLEVDVVGDGGGVLSRKMYQVIENFMTNFITDNHPPLTELLKRPPIVLNVDAVGDDGGLPCRQVKVSNCPKD